MMFHSQKMQKLSIDLPILHGVVVSSSYVGNDTDRSGEKEGDELFDLQLTSRDLAIKAMEEMLAENIKRIHDLLEAQQDGP